jgi:hypothetical protein
VGENICEVYISKRTHNQNIQGAQKAKFSKNQCINKKWTTELNRTYSKEDHIAKKHMKKMLTIPGHKGNVHQNHTKIPPHSC